jgi:hypothetical protein
MGPQKIHAVRMSFRNRPYVIGRGDKIRTCDPLHPMIKDFTELHQLRNPPPEYAE